MKSKIILISDAGRRFNRQKSNQNLNTMQRFRMYKSIDVEPTHIKSAKKKCPVQLSQPFRKDSYFLRYAKEMVNNVNYNPQDHLVRTSPRSQKFLDGHFQRIIGDVIKEDLSIPMPENCDKRCQHAFLELPHQKQIKTQRDVLSYVQPHHALNFSNQPIRPTSIKSTSFDLKKVNSNKSTQESEHLLGLHQSCKNQQSKKNLELHDALKKMRKFESDQGHRYGQLLFKNKKIPAPYDLPLVSKTISVSGEKAHYKFDRFKDRIATRWDRVDPLWSMTIQYETDLNNNKQKCFKMQQMSQRKPNQVFSEYPIRQSLKLNTPIHSQAKDNVF